MNQYDLSIGHRKKKIAVLIFFMFMTSIILVVSTYAWFVGTSSIETSSFTLSIGATDGLELSLDAENWSTESLSISKNLVEDAYINNKNKWPDNGLNPVSSNGLVDYINGRLILYQLGSITPTIGGYRFTASQIDNSNDEKEGYVAFDLFIRNGTEDAYINEYNELDNEAIYLTRTSKVIVTPSGSQSEDYGLANSVRVAFMQVGRVKSTTSQISSIISINCIDSTTNTELCSRVTPTIWEPNNVYHNINLITYFNNLCKNRTNLNTYTNIPCTTFTNNQDVDTYVVKQNITSSTLTDVYDGHNTYISSVLNNLETFTDTDKNQINNNRKPFFYLSGNSITKLRVYVYLEGQDVDNYYLISNGNTISINFGFTKDKYSTEESVEESNQVVMVTYNPNGGIVDTSSNEQIYGYNYSNLPIPTRTNYVFGGWYTYDIGGILITSSSIVTNSSNHILYAHWLPMRCNYTGTLTQGATFNDGIYTYKYKQEVETLDGYDSIDVTTFDWSSLRGYTPTWENISEDGWGVALNDYSITRITEVPCSSLGGKPIVSTQGTYGIAVDLKIINITGFDSSNVVNMTGMFAVTGIIAPSFEIIGLDDLDTSNVTSMFGMFAGAGSNASSFNIGNLSNWDTSNVIDMSYIFAFAGSLATTTFNIGNLNNWDTGNVLTMYRMFYYSGYSAPIWSVGDLSTWDTSKVLNMNDLFAKAGYAASSINLNLSNWDTSNVVDMYGLFGTFGYSATTWSVGNLSNWDTSSAVTFFNLFSYAAFTATEFNIGNIGSWDTSSITNMQGVFNRTGRNATTWYVGDLSAKNINKDGHTYIAWNTSSVTKMNCMFDLAAYSCESFDIGNIGTWNTSNLDDTSWMFEGTGAQATYFYIGNLSTWNTSNLTTVDGMFYNTASNLIVFELDLSGWTTSNISSMNNMFTDAGNSAITWIVKIKNNGTNTTSRLYGGRGGPFGITRQYATPPSGRSFTLV